MRRLSLLVLLCACDVVYRPGGQPADSARVTDSVARLDTPRVALTPSVVDTLAGMDSVDVAPRIPDVAPPAATPPAATPPADVRTDAGPSTASDVEQLRGRALRVPVEGVTAAQLRNTFDERRGGGSRAHEALDIMAPRGTPVLSADDGRVAKLFTSKPGGLTVYVASPDGQFMYYYAHLDRYRDGLAEGVTVRKGDLLGYVGSTGDASPDAPHLHFAIARVADPKQWWTGTPINPYPVLAPGR